ncbi:MAG TPA: hypothetical protein VMM13_11235 [Euzebya sp.]|nr:hypothetical protein [Euzebya sp.]
MSPPRPGPLEAYGDLSDVDVTEAVITRVHATIDLMTALAEQGVEPQRTLPAQPRLTRATRPGSVTLWTAGRRKATDHRLG